MNDKNILTLQKLEIDGNKILKYLSKDKENIIIPDGVEVIGEEAFSFHKEIKSIVFPVSLKRISVKAFSACSALKEVNLTDLTRLV